MVLLLAEDPPEEEENRNRQHEKHWNHLNLADYSEEQGEAQYRYDILPATVALYHSQQRHGVHAATRK
eukprot:jgi/Phyca11/509832/fgenesh2_kg.PHYCAscaffold_50_\